MLFYEKVSGTRMHSAYIRPGGIFKDLPKNLLQEVYQFVLYFNSRVSEIEELLTRNRIWRQRLLGVGIVSANMALNYSFSGVLLRSTGIK